jgi:hypothetical protein
MLIREQLFPHSYGVYTFFCAGKVFPSLDGDILPVEEGNPFLLPGIVFPHTNFRKIPASARKECSRRPPGHAVPPPPPPSRPTPATQLQQGKQATVAIFECCDSSDFACEESILLQTHALFSDSCKFQRLKCSEL